ncbi:MAG: hypothetical protein U0487_02140 [Patescibacteria group bacterium]
MMIPLWIFLFLWIGLATILCLAAVLAAMMGLRFGLAGSRTALMTLVFIGLPAAIIITTIQYAYTVDWSQSLTLFSASATLY